ncbi:MAG: DedA family protein [Phycisphaeraceae bacterium]|nr:DedA family protein [Phycisphaeraceae bacterium]
METLLANLPYVGLVVVLVLSGFGLPLPEDVPLIFAGYLCGIGEANIYIMLPVAFFAVLGTDLLVYWLGRRLGHHVPRLPVIRRYLSEKNLAKADEAFHRHGPWVLFIARFLPGIRTPVFFSAGAFKIPVRKMLAYDGSAALISVPTIVLLAYHLSDHLDKARKIVMRSQGAVLLVVFVVVVAVVLWQVWKRRRAAALATPTSAEPDKS